MAMTAAGAPALMSLNVAKAVLVLDSEGKRLLAKYYGKDFATVKEQHAFEKTLFEKTKRLAGGEITMFDGLISVYRNNIDVFFYVVGSAKENELILFSVLTAFYDAATILLRNQIERRSVLDNYDALVLALDELIDDGILLEADPSQIAARVSMKTESSSADVPFSEQTLSQALSTAKSITRSLLK